MLRFATRFGFFVENNFLPVTIGDGIPVPFRRDESGSNIDIIGIEKDSDSVDNILTEVIRNFWMAIHDGILEVKVEDVYLNKDNLYELMKCYFPRMADNTKRYSSTNTNLRPYYDAVANTGTDDAHRLFTDKQESVEKEKLYTTIIPMPRKAKAKISLSWGTIEIGVLGRTHPESSCHRRQKYYLTELGLNILRLLKSEAG